MKRMLIVVDGSPNDGDSLTCAVGVCRAVDGRLTVIHPRQPDQYIPITAGDVAPVVVDNREQSAAAAAAARQAYDTVCGGLAFTEWLFHGDGQRVPNFHNMGGALCTAGFLNALMRVADFTPISNMTGLFTGS